MELKEGKMTTKELAEWMNMSYASYRKKAAIKLEELKYFANYEKVYGGVIIKEVYVPYYERNVQ